jgi:hypothetical protein
MPSMKGSRQREASNSAAREWRKRGSSLGGQLAISVDHLVHQARSRGRMATVGARSRYAAGRAKKRRRLVKRRLDKVCRFYPNQVCRGRAKGSNFEVMSGWAGKVNLKVAPRGTFALAHNRPPCASMIERQIDSPNPKLPGFVV